MDLSPPRLKALSAWTPYRDDLAIGDATVRTRMRFLFTPLAVPALSANGARAGLGPDGVTGTERPQTDGVDMRPDPRLDRPIASRLADDISEAAQIRLAEKMGVHVPVEAPVLSATGKMAGLGAFAGNSSSPKAVATASMNELAMSRSKVAMTGRRTTAMQSARVPPMSDASASAGITGKNPIQAAERGFTMRLPKSPVAQDRERWASGTQDRIGAASKGLNLANMDWSDHRGAPPKPQPKRTWVGKQGDATECPDNCIEACADLAVAPHAAVNKGVRFRELEKERLVSDVCPPLRSSIETLEVMLRRDAYLLATAPVELLRTWASRPSIERGAGTASAIRAMSLKPAAGSMKGLLRGTGALGKSCGCDDCGCSGKSKSYAASIDNGSAANAPTRGGLPQRSTSEGSVETLLSLVDSFAVRHGKDGNSEWFVPVFQRKGRLVLGSEQRGPSEAPWHPDPSLGRRRNDVLVATIHTHSRRAEFSDEDRRAGDALGVPMILVAPWGERVRLYDPASRSIRDVPLVRARGVNAVLDIGNGPILASVGTHRGRAISSAARETQRLSSAGALITISGPGIGGLGGNAGASPVPTTTTESAPADITELAPTIIDYQILVFAVQLAAMNRSATPESIWWTLSGLNAGRAAHPGAAPKVIPDPDLFRAIVGVTQRRPWGFSVNSASDAYDVLAEAIRVPLFVEPTLLDLIIKYAQLDAPALPDIWVSAWSARVEMKTPLPTPPDFRLFQAIVEAARLAAVAPKLGVPSSGADAKTILALAHSTFPPADLSAPAVWPRYIDDNLLAWIVFYSQGKPSASEIEIVSGAVKTLVYFGDPTPERNVDSELMREIIRIAKVFPQDTARNVLNRALGGLLFKNLHDQAVAAFDPCGHEGQECCRPHQGANSSDDCDVCLDEGTLCFWDGHCWKNDWPDGDAYIQNQTIPGVQIDQSWTEEVQGLASDGAHWYVVQGQGENRLWKVPIDVNWDSDWGDAGYAQTDNDNLNNKRDHWGDPDFYKGRVYVPMEDIDPKIETNLLTEFDAESLVATGQALTSSNHAGSVAIHPVTGEFYIEDTGGGPAPVLNVYAKRVDGDFELGQPIRRIPLNVRIDGIGGLAFSQSGKLYVSGQGGVFAFQVSPNKAVLQHQLNVEASASHDEPEGITVRDAFVNDGIGNFIRTQIHVIVLVNLDWEKDDAWLKHIAVVPPSLV